LGVVFGRNAVTGGDPRAFAAQENEVFFMRRIPRKSSTHIVERQKYFRIIFRKMALFHILHS
jgi:hypothetical protein